MTSCEATTTTETITVTRTRVPNLIWCISKYIKEYEEGTDEIPDISEVILHVGDDVWNSYSSAYRSSIRCLVRDLRIARSNGLSLVARFKALMNGTPLGLEFEWSFDTCNGYYVCSRMFLTYAGNRVSLNYRDQGNTYNFWIDRYIKNDSGYCNGLVSFARVQEAAALYLRVQLENSVQALTKLNKGKVAE